VSAYREARKRDKALIELATRASDPRIQELLVQVLNQFQSTIRQAQEAPENAELMKTIKLQADIEAIQEHILATVTKDPVNLVTCETTEGKREARNRRTRTSAV